MNDQLPTTWSEFFVLLGRTVRRSALDRLGAPLLKAYGLLLVIGVVVVGVCAVLWRVG